MSKRRATTTLVASLGACLAPFLALALLPLDQFGFRAWDSLIVKSSYALIIGPFYPLASIKRDEVGDLAPYTADAVVKPGVVWQTDRLGFRNAPDRCSDPQIVVVGDSMAIGAGVSQEDELSVQLERELGVCARNLGGIPFEQALAVLTQEKLKPRVIVHATPEHNLSLFHPYSDAVYARALKIIAAQHFLSGPLSTWLARIVDAVIDSPFHAYKASHGISAAVARALADRDRVPLRPAVAPSGRMLQLPGQQKELRPDDVARALRSMHAACEARAAHWMVLSVPERENIYPDRFSPARPTDALATAQDALQRSLAPTGMHYVDLTADFRAAYERDGTLSHHLDDTHWNAQGIRLGALALAQRIRQAQLLGPQDADSPVGVHAVR